MEVPILIAVASLAFALLRGKLCLSLPQWRGGVLLLGALVVQVYFVAFPPQGMARGDATVIYLGTQALVALFLVLNRKVSGLWLVAVGLGLNAMVVATNGAMPVSAAAIATANAESLTDPRHTQHGVHLRNELMTSETRLRPLSDVIPVPPFQKVLSVGDLFVAAGLLTLARSAFTAPGKAPARSVHPSPHWQAPPT